MSTRSVIAKPTRTEGWKGRYCHYDGYPGGRGPALWQTYRELDGDIDAVRAYALVGEWSSYMTPSEAAINDERPDTIPCEHCDGIGKRLDLTSQRACSVCCGTGMATNWAKRRGMYTNTASGWIGEHEDGCGTRWCYVLGRTNLTVKVYRDFDWVTVGRFPWAGDEPDWDSLLSGDRQTIVNDLTTY